MSVPPKQAAGQGIVVAGALVMLAVVTWVYLWREATHMEMGGARVHLNAMMTSTAWTLGELAALIVMWVVMMAAMMVPSVAPVVMLFTKIERARQVGPMTAPRSALFLLGYLVIWSVFSVLAAVAQWVLHGLALLSAMMVATSPLLGGALLSLAGLFQWTPVKRACLRSCRSPLGFLTAEWRSGPRGAILMGLRHGLLCLGCCWAIMALLFVAGVMNLSWVAAIAAFVLLEKVLPGGEILGRAAGVVFVVAGFVLSASWWSA